MPLVTPLNAGCRGKCVIGSPRAHSGARASDRCDSGRNKRHTFSKREKISSSAYHKHSAFMQPFFRAYSTSCHTGRGLAGHPRCVRMGNGYDKTRLFTPIRSETTTFPWGGPHHSTQRECSSSACRGDESASKGSHRSHSSSERVRLLQLLLPRPQKDGGLRPILDLRLLNRALVKRSFRMITSKQILLQICPGDWFMSLDLKDAYFHMQVAPHHRRFLRFAFEGVVYQFKVLPFGLSLAPRTFTRCIDAALSPLRQMGIRILNYLDDWLILAGFNVARDPSPQPLRPPGAQGQLCQECTVTQPTSGVPGDSYRLGTDDGNCLSGTSHDDSAPCALLQRRDHPLAQSLSENVGTYGSSFASTSVGPTSHATHPVLSEAEGSICGLASRSPSHNGDLGLCISPEPLERPPLAEARCELRHGAQKEGCHDRRFQQGLGGVLCEGKPAFGPRMSQVCTSTA